MCIRDSIEGDYVLSLAGNHAQSLGLAHPVIHLHIKAFNLPIDRSGDGTVLHLSFVSQFSGDVYKRQPTDW